MRAISTERLARSMLTQSGVRAIWDAHLAASAAYGLGRFDMADSLIEIAEAAEREWIRRSEAIPTPAGA